MEKLDCLLFEYLLKQDEIQNFKMIRYVDDLYILFNSDLENTNLETIYNKICSYISSVIKDFDLSLNYEKCSISETKDINQVLKQSLYDEYFHEISFKISQFYLNDIDEFLDHLIDCNEKHILTNKEYRESITKYLTHEDIEFSAIEIFNYFVYNKDSFDLVPNSVDKVKRLFEADLNILCLDPKLLTILLLKTKDEELIKKMLNNEFSKFHSSNWTKYDSAIVINYLIQRNFQHFDIKQCLVTESKKLKIHIESYCESSFFEILNDDANSFIATLLCEDWKSGFIYLMFLAEMQRKNLLTSYAYFKNFFDRITAFLENKDHPDFNKFFKEKNFISFYSEIENSEDILKKAFKMRNNNPVSHASAELINEHYRNEDIVEMINKLHHLLILYIKDKFTE